MTNPTVIALDVDSVLVDFLHAFYEYMASIGIHPKCAAKDEINFAMQGAFPGMIEKEKNNHIRNFIKTSFYDNLPPVSGAVEGVQKLRNTWGDQIHICAVTSTGTSEEVLIKRTKHLEPFDIKDIHLVDLSETKVPTLQKINAAVLLDDHAKNIDHALDADIPAFLFTTGPNKELLGYNRANSWPEAVQKINTVISKARKSAA